MAGVGDDDGVGDVVGVGPGDPVELGVGVGVWLGVGAEVAFGHTDIYVHERKVAVLPPLRLVSSLGLRHYF